MVEQLHLQNLGVEIEGPVEDVLVWYWLGGQSSVEWTFYQYFCWDLGLTFEYVWLLWPPGCWFAISTLNIKGHNQWYVRRFSYNGIMREFKMKAMINIVDVDKSVNRINCEEPRSVETEVNIDIDLLHSLLWQSDCVENTNLPPQYWAACFLTQVVC